MASLQQLVAYISQYRARYSVAALKSQLIKQGIPEAEIDQAIRMALAAPAGAAPAPTQPPQTNPPATRPPGQPAQTPTPGVRQPWQPPQTVPPWQSRQTVPPGTMLPVPPQGAPRQMPAPQQTPFPGAPAASPSGHVPQTSAPAAAQPPATQPPAGAGPVKPPPGRTYILVVDDDQLIRDMMANKLESAGYRVTCAEDAAQSVIQAEGMRLALIISDIEMPGFGTGVDALKKLRSSSFVRNNLPVIFVTGMPPGEARKIVPKTDPYVRLLHKPVDWKLLRQYIKDLTGLDNPLD